MTCKLALTLLALPGCLLSQHFGGAVQRGMPSVHHEVGVETVTQVEAPQLVVVDFAINHDGVATGQLQFVGVCRAERVDITRTSTPYRIEWADSPGLVILVESTIAGTSGMLASQCLRDVNCDIGDIDPKSAGTIYAATAGVFAASAVIDAIVAVSSSAGTDIVTRAESVERTFACHERSVAEEIGVASAGGVSAHFLTDARGRFSFSAPSTGDIYISVGDLGSLWTGAQKYSSAAN